MTNPFDVLEPGRPYFPDLVAGMQSPIRRYLMMPTVVHALRAQDRPVSVLEVGSWIGTSALVWAEAIDRFCPGKGALLCVDAWEPYFDKEGQVRVSNENYLRMTRLAESGLAYQLFLHNAKCSPSSVPIRHFRGASGDVLPYLAGAAFDIVYIDGSHAYDQVRADLAQGVRLVRNGGFLCGDDLELQWDESDKELTVRFCQSDAIFDPGKGLTYHPGVTRAVGERFGKVSVYFGFWVVRRMGEMFMPVNLASAMAFVPSHLAAAYAEAGLAPGP
jgi:SAM-dependent methyltransferase